MKKVELLAPAGDFEKLKIAIEYGADAVYFCGEMFSLRAGAGNLTVDEIREGVEYAHARGRKAYLTVNIFAHNEDIQPLAEYLEKIKKPIKVAVMGCVVNGPGEASAADYGVAGGKGKGVLFSHGKKIRTVPADRLADELIELIEEELS